MNILVVDDEPLIRTLVGSYLEGRGHCVETAENGLVAWNMLSDSQNQYKVVLADVNMPVLDGRELARRIHKHDMKIPVVLMSGQINFRYEDALREGASRILHKPFELSAILSILEEFDLPAQAC